MKINYPQLTTHLTKALHSIYLVSGEELLLKQDALQQIRKKAKAEGFTDRSRLSPDTGYDWSTLHGHFYAGSLLQEKRLIELDCKNITIPKQGSELLQAYSNRPATDCLLIIDIGKIDDKIAKSAWYKAVEKAGVVITVWPITRDQLPEWIRQRAQKYRITLEPAAISLMADYTEGNLVAAAQLLEKMYLLQRSEPITIDLLQAIITDDSHFTVFDFVDQLISNNTERALHVLEGLKGEGTELTLIIWAMAREIRLLFDMSNLLKQGIRHDELWQRYRIFSRRQPTIKQFLSTISASTCLSWLLDLGHIDKITKGALPGNPWHALQLLCLKMKTSQS